MNALIRIALREMRGGRTGIAVGDRLGADQRAGLVALVEQGTDQRDGSVGIAGRIVGIGVEHRQAVVGAERPGVAERGIGSTVEQAGSHAALADPLEPAGGQGQRIAVGIAARDDRAQRIDGIAGGIGVQQRHGEQLSRGDVHRLLRDEVAERFRRLLIIAGLQRQRAAQQQAAGQRRHRAAGLAKKAAGEIDIVGAGGDHRLEV